MSQLTIPDTQRLNVADALKQLLVATGAAESAEDYPANAKISFLLKALLEHYGGESEETSDRVSEIISVLAKAIEENGGGSEPSGSISITENGIHDVAAFETADVNVPADLRSLFNSTLTITNSHTEKLNIEYLGVWGSGADAEFSMLSSEIPPKQTKTFNLINGIFNFSISTLTQKTQVIATSENGVATYTATRTGQTTQKSLIGRTFAESASLTVNVET